jgi:hypothetical protein
MEEVRMAQPRHQYGDEMDLDTDVVLDNQGERLTEMRAAEIAEEVLTQVHSEPPAE